MAREPVGGAWHTARGSCAGLAVQALIDVEIGGVFSVSIVSGFRVDQVPLWTITHGHCEVPGRLRRPIADGRELALWGRDRSQVRVS